MTTHTTKHTPGPWVAFGETQITLENGMTENAITIVDTENNELAYVYDTDHATLIAAAPAMLEALENIFLQLDQFTIQAQIELGLRPAFMQIKQAIAAAEGHDVTQAKGQK